MAYEVALLCHFETDPASLANDVRSLAERLGLPVADERAGEGWRAIDVGPADAGTVVVEIHVEDEVTQIEVRDASEDLDQGLLSDVNGVVVLTLSGDVDEAFIEAVTDLFDSACRVVHDEIDGFRPS